MFLCALIGSIGTTFLLHISFSDTFLRTLYLGFFGGVLSVLVFGYIAVYLDIHAGWKLGFLEEAVLLMALPFSVNAWKLEQKK